MAGKGLKLDKAELVKRLQEGSVPDEEIRQLMRVQIERRLQCGYKDTHEQQTSQIVSFAKSLREMKIADETDVLDSKIYEAPIPFLQIMCGDSIKGRIDTSHDGSFFSSSYFKDESLTLDEAEKAMLELYCKKSQIRDGQKVLDLGCGQGAVTLYIAQNYRNCDVTAITNSKTQKDFVEEQCRRLNLANVVVLLEDITTLELEATFDRILVIGLFEHMKNYFLLLRKISQWMSQDGLLFIEHVCHKTLAYHYKPIDEDDWFTDYIFPDGTMLIPSASFLLYFQDDVCCVDHWTLSGKHFSRSNEEWLKRLDANADTVKAIMESVYGKEEATKWVNYWRGLCISGSELFGFKNGEEWMISHILFRKK